MVVVVVHGGKREHSTVTLNSLPRISPGSSTPQPSSMRGGTCPLLPLKMQGEFFFSSSSSLFLFFSFLLCVWLCVCVVCVCVCVCLFFFLFSSFRHFQSYVVCPPTGRRNTSNLYGLSFNYSGNSKIIVLLPRYRRRDASRAHPPSAHVAYPAPPAEYVK